MFSKHNPKGRIKSPKSRSAVSRHFQVEGTVNNMTADQHLILAIRVDGLLWPKGEVQMNGSIWKSEVHENGNPPRGKFTLELYRVENNGYDEIITWLARGEQTGHYPGLRKINNGVKLHSIKLRLKL